MADPLEQQLVWDISDALASIQGLDSALQSVVADFTAGLTAAITELSSTPVEIDTSSLTSSVTDAIDSISAPIPVEADTTALDAALSDALDAPRDIPVDGDTAALTAAVTDAVATPATVDVQGDVSEAAAAIDALNTSPVTVDVDADTSQAQNELDSLGVSATSAAGHPGGGDGLHGVETAVLGIEAAAGGAQGETSGLAAALGSVSTEAAAAATGGAAYIGFLGEAVSLAADAQAQQNRFNDVFGKSAEIVQHIDVGGLKISLEELGKTSGTTTANLEASASRVGLLGNAAGAAQPEIAKTAGDLLGLAGALAVSNPRFGDASTVADTFSRALSTGRTRSLIPYGISLSQNAILQEALNENTGKTKDTLTGYDKLVAGLTLALEQQGNTLGTKYAKGVQNAQVELRALKVSLEETLVAVGGPLLEPVVASLTDIVPVAQEVGIVLGDVGQIIVPLLAAATPLLAPLAAVLGLTADGLQGIQVLLSPLDSGLGTIAVGIGLVTLAAYTVVPALQAMFIAGSLSMGPVGWVVLGVAALAALGGALDLFGHHSKSAALDTTALNDSFTGSTSGAAAFSNVLGNLNKSVDDYLQKNLKISVDGKSGVDVTNELGLSFGTLTDVITGTEPGFQKFLANIDNSAAAQSQNNGAFSKFQETIVSGRLVLEQNAGATIAAAQASGLLTAAQVKQAQAAHVAFTFNDDYGNKIIDNIAVLRELAPQLAIATKLSQDDTFAKFKQSDQYGGLQKSIKANAVTLSDAKNVATQYNITQDQATEVIQNTQNAMDRSAASTSLNTKAFRDLVDAIATGSVGEIDAQLQLQAMGFSADGASSAYKALSSTIDTAVKNIVSNLPSAGDAAKTWASDIKAAFTTAANDASNHTGHIKADLATLVADSDPAKFAQNLIEQATSVVKFEANLKTLISEGFGALAGFIAQQPFDVAGPLADKLASDESKAKLVAGAVQLSQAVSGPQAQKFFDDNARALGLETGTQLANGVIIGGAAVGAAVEQVGQGAAARFHPDFSGRISAEVNAAAAALAADPQIGQAAGQKGLEALAAYEDKFGPIPLAAAVQVALGGAHDAIQNDPTLAAAAGKKGDDTKGAFKPDIAGQAKTQFEAGADGIRNVGQLAVQAGKKGYDVGVAFDSGLVEGLNQQDGTSRISSAAAGLGGLIEASIKSKLGIKSPSTVGIQLGRDVISGITLGLGNSSSLAAAGGAVGQSIAAAGTQAVGSVIAGFNDSATVNAAIVKLQSLIASASARTSSTASSNAAQQQLASFISSAVSSLPGSTSAISAFSTGISTALSKQTSAFTAYRKSVHDMRADQADVTKLTHETAAAYVVLLAAQQRLEADTAAHAGKQTIAVDKQGVSDATSAFDKLKSKLDSATAQFDRAVADFNSKSKTLKGANTQLDTAEDPATFTKSLNAKTAQERQFQANIAKLVKLGDVDLAQQLAQAGVDSAGALAKGLASSPAKAKAAEAAVDHAKAFSDSYQAFLEKEFAPKASATVTSAVTPKTTPTGIIAGTQIVTTPATSVTLASAPPAGPALPTVLELDLNITLPDGRVVTAKKQVLVPKPAPKTTKTRVHANVVGKVNA